MKLATSVKRFVAAAAMSGTVAVAAAALGTPAASADPFWGPSYQGGNCPDGLTCTHWCPGDPPIPGSQVVTWDWNVCHDWYWNSEGVVDVTTNTIYLWSGQSREATPPPQVGPPPPAPPPEPLPPDCPPWSPFFAPSRCGGL